MISGSWKTKMSRYGVNGHLPDKIPIYIQGKNIEKEQR